MIRWVVRPLGIIYFGNHDMEGGKLGAKMDRRARRFHRRRIEKRRRERLRELEIVLPPLDEARNEKYLTIASDILARRAERKRKLYHVMQDVQKRRIHCDSLPTSFQDSNATAIPRHVLQPNYGSWFRPRNDKRMTIVPFEEHDKCSYSREFSIAVAIILQNTSHLVFSRLTNRWSPVPLRYVLWSQINLYSSSLQLPAHSM